MAEWIKVALKASESLRGAVIAVVGNPVTLVLVPLGLILTLWYHDLVMPKDYWGASLLYMLAVTATLGLVHQVKKTIPEGGISFTYWLYLVSIMVAEVIIAFLAYPAVSLAVGPQTALVVVVGFWFVFSAGWVLLESLWHHAGKGDNNFYKYSIRLLVVPLLWVISMLMPFLVETLPAIQTVAYRSAAIETTRSSVAIVGPTIQKAENSTATLQGMANSLQAAQQTLLTVINSEDKVAPTQPLTETNGRRIGPLSRTLRAALVRVENASTTLTPALAGAENELKQLRSEMDKQVKLLENINVEKKVATNSDDIFNELVRLQTVANRIIAQNASTAQGVAEVFTGLSTTMEALITPEVKPGRAAEIRAHVDSINGVATPVLSTARIVSAIQPSTERPQTKNPLAVVFDFTNLQQFSGTVADASRPLVAGIVPGIFFIMAIAGGVFMNRRPT